MRSLTPPGTGPCGAVQEPRVSRPGAGQLEQAGRPVSLTGHAGVVLAAGPGPAPGWRPGQAGLGLRGHERAPPAGAVGLPRRRAALPAVIRCRARCRDRRRGEAARPGLLLRSGTGHRRRPGHGAAGTPEPGAGQSALPGLQPTARVGTTDLRRDPRPARALRPGRDHGASPPRRLFHHPADRRTEHGLRESSPAPAAQPAPIQQQAITDSGLRPVAFLEYDVE